MNALAQAAANEIDELRNNKEAMAFATDLALEQTSKDMNAKGFSTTAKGVEMLAIRHKNIAAQVERYVIVGLMEVYFKSIQA